MSVARILAVDDEPEISTPVVPCAHTPAKPLPLGPASTSTVTVRAAVTACGADDCSVALTQPLPSAGRINLIAAGRAFRRAQDRGTEMGADQIWLRRPDRRHPPR